MYCELKKKTVNKNEWDYKLPFDLKTTQSLIRKKFGDDIVIVCSDKVIKPYKYRAIIFLSKNSNLNYILKTHVFRNKFNFDWFFDKWHYYIFTLLIDRVTFYFLIPKQNIFQNTLRFIQD